MQLSHDQIIDVYAGTNLKGDKRDATVNGEEIPFSGVANYILLKTLLLTALKKLSILLFQLRTMLIYIQMFILRVKLSTTRTFRQKYDGNRPLAVYVDWYANNGKLDYKIQFDTPLEQGGDYAYARLKAAMDILE